MELKKMALIKFLELDNEEAEEIEETTWDTLEYYNEEYKVLTDEEADEEAENYILDSLWAFYPQFLENYSEVADAEVFKLLQAQCEDSNEAIKRLIDDVDILINDAIGCDGRGHFLNTYDGEEHEQKINNEWYFIYRVN